jgi:hypothetical protein
VTVPGIGVIFDIVQSTIICRIAIHLKIVISEEATARVKR